LTLPLAFPCSQPGYWVSELLLFTCSDTCLGPNTGAHRWTLSKDERSAVAQAAVDELRRHAEELFRQRSQVIAWLLRPSRLRSTSKGRPTVSRFRDLTEGLRCYRHPILVPHNGSPQAVPCCLIRTSKSRSPYDVLIVGPIWTFWERSSMGGCFFRQS